MDDFLKLRKIYELKKVYRRNSVEKRHESSAEHSWSAILVADYLLNFVDQKIDRLKVYDLLLYHDIVEIETGDIPVLEVKDKQAKEANELLAMEVLAKKLPKEIQKKAVALFNEYVERKTVEARFAVAVDKMDAILHALDYKDDWKTWDEKILRNYSEKKFAEFPKILAMFEEIVKFLNENKFFG